MAHSPPPSGTTRPKRAAWRETPTGEALAFDRWRFSGALGGIPGETRIVRPGAFGLFFDCPPLLGFLDPQTGQPREGALLDGGIAVLTIAGPLEHQESWWWASYHAIRRELETALSWPGVEAVVPRFDTPGGVCAGMLACHRAIRELRAKYNKPVVAFVDEMAASAGYGLASACDEIWLPPEGVVGSIGVILCTIDETKRLEKEGIAVRYVVTGSRKADLQPGAPVTDDVLGVAQAKVDELGARFFSAVAAARGMTPAAVEALEAAVFMGEAAVSSGLADGVADWNEFLGTLRRSFGASVGTPVGTLAQPGATRAAQPKADAMALKRLQAQKAKDDAAAALDVAKAAVAAATGPALAKAMAALTEAAARLTAAEGELAKVVHREKYEKVTTETPDKDEKAADEPPPSTAPSGKMEDAEEDPEAMDSASDMPMSGEGDEDEEARGEKALMKAYRSGSSAMKAAGAGELMHYGPSALLALLQKALGTTGVRDTFGALSALPSRLAAVAKVEKDVQRLKTESRAQRIDAILRDPANAGKIGGKAHRQHLRAEGLERGSAWLRGHLALAPVAIRTEASALEPKEGDDGRGQFTAAADNERDKILATLKGDLTPEQAAKFEKDFNANLAAKAPKFPKV